MGLPGCWDAGPDAGMRVVERYASDLGGHPWTSSRASGAGQLLRQPDQVLLEDGRTLRE